MRAYTDVASCRMYGMAVGPIPFTAVIEWAALFEFDRDATMLLWGVIRHLEGERAQREQRERELDNMRGR